MAYSKLYRWLTGRKIKSTITFHCSATEITKLLIYSTANIQLSDCKISMAVLH